MCPFVDMDTVRRPHTSASLEALRERLNAINSISTETSPSKDLFLKTFVYFTALKRQGCGSRLCEPTHFSGDEEKTETERLQQRDEERRGHEGKPTCRGRLLMEFSQTDGHSYIRQVYRSFY